MSSRREGKLVWSDEFGVCILLDGVPRPLRSGMARAESPGQRRMRRTLGALEAEAIRRQVLADQAAALTAARHECDAERKSPEREPRGVRAIHRAARARERQLMAEHRAELEAAQPRAARRDRVSVYDSIFVVVPSPPKRGDAARRFRLMRSHMTVGQFLGAGGTRRDVRRALKDGHIELRQNRLFESGEGLKIIRDGVTYTAEEFVRRFGKQ